jgi:DNA-binding transcriptional MocR family regulator
MSPFTSAIVRGVIEVGDLDRHVQKLINTYRPRLLKMDSLLRKHLPDVMYETPQGGYFFWLRLPEHMDAAELRKQAKSHNVGVRQGALFSCDNGLRNYVRLCFAYYDEAQIEEGIARLKECFESM